MDFNKTYLKIYENLIKTTDLKKGYQEFIRLFRYIKVELQKEFPTFSFSGNIVENGMDYSYFQLVNETLKNNGLKVVISFIHSDFNFEVWLSGYNRKWQIKFYEKLKNQGLEYELNHQPSKLDYIIKLPLNRSIDFSDGNALVVALKESIENLLGLALESLLKTDNC